MSNESRTQSRAPHPRSATPTGSGGPSHAVCPHAVCPFCALHCDDIAQPLAPAAPQSTRVTMHGVDVRGADGHAVRLHRLCERGAAGFRTAHDHGTRDEAAPRIAGEKVGLDAAIARAADLLHAMRAPLVAGLAADVRAIQNALALAERIGAVTDQCAFEGRWRNLRTVQEHGAVMTTFAEVRNRADLVVLVGDDPLGAWPRATERLLADDYALYLKPGERRMLTIPLEPGGEAALIDRIGRMSLRLVQGTQKRAPAGIRFDATADHWLERIQAARYPVFIWNAGRFGRSRGDDLAMRLLRFITQLNRTQRAAALPVGGNDGEAAAEAVHLWTTGYPARTRLGGHAADYDPEHHDAAQLLARREVDGMVWLSTIDPMRVPPSDMNAGRRGRRRVPTIVIGHPGMPAESADVFIPVGVPGLHHAGQMFRGDRIVSLPVQAWADTSLPRAADVLAHMRDQLRDPMRSHRRPHLPPHQGASADRGHA